METLLRQKVRKSTN